MKKGNKFLALLLVLCLTAGVLCACTDNPDSTPNTTTTGSNEPEPSVDETVLYHFVVVDEEGNPVEGAKVQLCSVEDGSCYLIVPSDAEGKVEYDKVSAYGVYQVHILANSLPSGYEFDNDSVTTSEDVHEYTLVVKKKCSHEFVNNVCSQCGAMKNYLATNPMQVSIGYAAYITLDEARTDEDPEDSWDNSKYFFRVTPTKQEDVGHYRVSVVAPEGVTIYLGRYNTNVVNVAHESVTGENPSLEFNMEKRYLINSDGDWTFHTSWQFGICVEGEAEYPITVRVLVERIDDLKPGENCVAYDLQYPEAAATETADSVLGDLSDKTLVTPQMGIYRCSACDTMPKDPQHPPLRCANCDHKFDSKNDLMINQITPVLGDDGYYHVDTADGPILLVNLTEPNVYLTVSFTEVNSLSVKDELVVHYTIDALHEQYIYYESMLKEYAALCNDDGYYMVNDQLYTFLVEWVSQNVSSLDKGGLDEIHAILPLCGYYA